MLINKLDKDGNGTISLDELKAAEWLNRVTQYLFILLDNIILYLNLSRWPSSFQYWVEQNWNVLRCGLSDEFSEFIYNSPKQADSKGCLMP